MNEDERTKLEQQIAFNEKERGLYIMRASKAILLILHRGFILWHIKNMAEAVDIDVIHFEDKYDKADRIDEANLDESINELNRSIREQEELENRIHRTEWSSMNEDERTKLEQQTAFNEKEWGLYIMRASKTVLLILHRGFDKIKQGGRVLVLDEKAAEKLYN